MIKNIFNKLGFGNLRTEQQNKPALPHARDIIQTIDCEILEKGWMRVADFMPIYYSHAKEHLPKGVFTNSLFFMSSELGTRIVNGEIACFYPDENVFRPEEAYLKIADIFDLIKDTGRTSAKMEHSIKRMKGRRPQDNTEENMQKVYSCALLAVKDRLDDVVFAPDLERSALKRYNPAQGDPPPPYALSSEGEAAFHFVLRKGKNSPVRRLGGTSPKTITPGHPKLDKPK